MKVVKQQLMKGLAFLLILSIFIGIPIYAKADYNTATNGGVVVVAFYVEGGRYYLVRPSTGKIVKIVMVSIWSESLAIQFIHTEAASSSATKMKPLSILPQTVTLLMIF